MLAYTSFTFMYTAFHKKKYIIVCDWVKNMAFKNGKWDRKRNVESK